MHTAEEKFACIQRELALRRRVYPRWIGKGHITEAKAKREIAIMQEIADDYEILMKKERLL